MAEGNPTAFTKTICSICYEDLKPIIEDLQSISVSGHAFHELCQLEIPMTEASQKPREYCQNPEELYNEVKRLEGKVSGLTSALEQHQKNFNSAMAELSVCKEQCKVEQTLKNETLKQKAEIQQLLHLKSEELYKSTLECMRLQESSTTLAKELASLKLVSDLNLVEDEMLKLASLGNKANSKEIIEVPRKTLWMRNKSYKELMVKCIALGRGEAHSLSKLEKANEKIKKLKVRIQELEKVIEVNDNISFDQASKTPKGKSFTVETDVNQAAKCDILSSSTAQQSHGFLQIEHFFGKANHS